MIANRRYATKIVPGTIALYPSTTVPVFEHKEQVLLGLEIAEYVSGHEVIAASGSFTPTLPPAYTNATRLYCQYRVEGVLQVTTTTPTNTSVVLLTGSSAQKGRFTTIDFVTSIVILNPTAAAVQFSYVLFDMPDLTNVVNPPFYTGY